MEFDGKLEPEAKDSATALDAGIISIAVSLKRIADELCTNPRRLGLVDGMFEISNK